MVCVSGVNQRRLALAAVCHTFYQTTKPLHSSQNYHFLHHSFMPKHSSNYLKKELDMPHLLLKNMKCLRDTLWTIMSLSHTAGIKNHSSVHCVFCGDRGRLVVKEGLPKHSKDTNSHLSHSCAISTKVLIVCDVSEVVCFLKLNIPTKESQLTFFASNHVFLCSCKFTPFHSLFW